MTTTGTYFFQNLGWVGPSPVALTKYVMLWSNTPKMVDPRYSELLRRYSAVKSILYDVT